MKSSTTEHGWNVSGDGASQWHHWMRIGFGRMRERFQGCKGFFAGKLKDTRVRHNHLEIEGGNLIEQGLRRCKIGAMCALIAQQLLDRFGCFCHETPCSFPASSLFFFFLFHGNVVMHDCSSRQGLKPGTRHHGLKYRGLRRAKALFCQEESSLLAFESSTDSMHKEARYQRIEYDGWQSVEHGVGGQLSVVYLAITSEKSIDMNRSRQ